MEVAQGHPQRPASPALTVPLAVPAGAQSGRRWARPQVTRPDGPVWQVIRKNCTMRHGIDDYAFFALDRAGWQARLNRSTKGGAYTVFFSDPETWRLLDHACTPCHTLARVERACDSEEAWRALLVDMRKRGAQVTDEEERLAE